MAGKKNMNITIDLSSIAGLLSSLGNRRGDHWKRDFKAEWITPDFWDRQYDDDDDALHQEERQFDLPVKGDFLSVDAGGNGSIHITGWDRQEIQVKASIKARGADEAEAEEVAESIEIKTSGGRIRAKGPRRRDSPDWWVDYEVQVPHEIDLHLETGNGAVSIHGVRGSIRFETSNGSVSLDDLGGDVRGRTGNGKVDIHLHGSTWDGNGLDVEAGNGRITVQVPEDYSAEVEAVSRRGQVDLDFPVQISGNLSQRLRTTLGDGGPRLRVATRNGRIRLERP